MPEESHFIGFVVDVLCFIAAAVMAAGALIIAGKSGGQAEPPKPSDGHGTKW